MSSVGSRTRVLVESQLPTMVVPSSSILCIVRRCCASCVAFVVISTECRKVIVPMYQFVEPIAMEGEAVMPTEVADGRW